MTDDEHDDAGTPDTDPRHIAPAGDLDLRRLADADLVEYHTADDTYRWTGQVEP